MQLIIFLNKNFFKKYYRIKLKQVIYNNKEKLTNMIKKKVKIKKKDKKKMLLIRIMILEQYNLNCNVQLPGNLKK